MIRAWNYLSKLLSKYDNNDRIMIITIINDNIENKTYI